MTTRDNDDAALGEATCSRKIEFLSEKSREFHGLGVEQRLKIVNSILANIDILGDDKMHRHDTAVLKLGPVPEPSENCGRTPPAPFSRNEEGASADYVCTPEVKKSKSLVKFLFTYYVVTCLKTIQKNLNHQLKADKKKPALLQKVRHEVFDGKKLRIHGPVEVFPILHKMEVWAEDNHDYDSKMEAYEDDPTPTLSSSNQERYTKHDEHDANQDGICVVLGGGNQSVITFADVLQCLFHHPRKPVLIKHHPLRPHLYDTCAQLFAPLIDAGYVSQVRDEGLPQSVGILQHPSVQHVHVTGAYSTAVAIERTLSESRPHLPKDAIQRMITTELGCATPWIIVPETYTKHELHMAAKHIVTSKKFNAGCNCLCGQVVILPQQWEQKDEFRAALVQMFERVPTEPLYYPGSKDKVLDIVSQYGEERVTQVSSVCVERNVVDGGRVHGVSSYDEEDYVQMFIVECGTYGETDYNDFAIKNEAFGPLIAVVELPPASAAEQNSDDKNSCYLCDVAVPFVNDKENIFGSLSCSIIFPKHYDESVIRDATAKLNYGSIGLNAWTSYAYAACAQGGTWGGSIYDSTGQSGRGYIGNHYEIPNVIKTVVRSRSLTFPLLMDKTFLPPSFMTELATKVFLHWGKFGVSKEAVKNNTQG